MSVDSRYSDDDNGNYFVGMMDILGFKYLVRRSPSLFLDHTHRMRETLLSCYSGIQQLWNIKCRSEGASVRTDYFNALGDPGSPVKCAEYWKYVEDISNSLYFFSDTVFFHIRSARNKDDQVVQLRAIASVMNSLLVLPGLRSEGRYQIMMRGAIAYGPAHIEPKRNLFFGTPVVDAYELSEGQKWMGAALHDSVNPIAERGRGKKHHLIGFDAPLLAYDIPLDENYRSEHKDVIFALNWYQSHRSIVKPRDGIPEYSKLGPSWKSLMEENILCYNWDVNDEVRMKRDNTIEFASRVDHSFQQRRVENRRSIVRA